MRVFGSIRKLLVASDSTNCLKPKKKEKNDYHGSCLYKPLSVLVQATVYPAMLQGLAAPLSLDTVVSQAPSLCPKFTFLARRAERELFLSLLHQSPWVEPHLLRLDHVSLPGPIRIFGYNYTSCPGLGHMTIQSGSRKWGLHLSAVK